MSREIKFRAWESKEKRWAAHRIMPALKGIIESLTLKDCLPISGRLIIEQYTGLKDKNGKEIYDGDILEFTKGPVQAVVIWNQPHAEFQIKWLDCKVEDSLSWHLHDHGGAKVIGNIHENPELFGGGE